jgi:DUF1680 family protein
MVYCLELPKQEGGVKVFNRGVFLPENIQLKPEHRDEFLGGVTVLTGSALTRKGRAKFVKAAGKAPASETTAGWENVLYRPFTPRILPRVNHERGVIEIALVPYYTWANRGLSMMEVWLPLAR